MRRELLESIRTGQPKVFLKLPYQRKYLSIYITPFSEGAIVTTLNVTQEVLAELEKKKFEAQLLHSQKMEAVGTLAAGIAHDFNNILWIITGNAELAKAEITAAGVSAQGYLERVETACRRAQELVTQILNFSRQTVQEKKPLILNSIIKESLKLLRSSLPATIEIRRHVSDSPLTIMADLSQINQVLMNLCTNAAFAMKETGGILEIGLTELELQEADNPSGENLAPGRYAVLSVMDTGKGIAPEVMDRIFDPFFTTKRVDEGTGMGLSVAHGIVKNHGGAVTAYSQPGKGAMFHVLLPLIDSRTEEAPVETLGIIPRGNESILIVDDDESLLEMEENILERLGYKVTSVRSADEALERFRSSSKTFDLVITDQTMPHKTGEQFARELLALEPDARIILCTGYSETISEEKAMAMGIRAFLMKPVVIARLAHTVRKVLDTP
jgi:two-component system, cell cycle sensor histidine kinase and response regulator CckA